MPVAFSEDEVRAAVRALGARIRAEFGQGEILLLCVLKGAFVFTADLLRAIPGDVRVEFIDKVQDLADTEVAEATEIDFFSHCALRGRNVFIVKDVVATGVIESYLLNHLRLKEPKSLKLVALIDRREARTMPLDVDYFAFRGEDAAYFGYGLDGATGSVNLPYISRVSRKVET